MSLKDLKNAASARKQEADVQSQDKAVAVVLQESRQAAKRDFVDATSLSQG